MFMNGNSALGIVLLHILEDWSISTECSTDIQRHAVRFFCCLFAVSPHRDLSRGYEEVPVTCVNGVDQEPFPGDFKYVPENCFTTQVNIDENITHLQVSVRQKYVSLLWNNTLLYIVFFLRVSLYIFLSFDKALHL